MDGAKAAGIRLPKPGEYPAIAVFLAVVGVGLGLRVWTAITRPAHGDELGQIEVASRSLGGLLDGVASHLSPPLSYLITAGFAHGLDTSDLFIMRVPSVAAGSLAIVAQFFLARALGYSDRVAIVSALLVALSAYLIGQSTWARMYGEYLLVSQLLLLSYIQFGSTGRRSWLAAWLVSAIALVYLHYFSWILLGALVVHAATQAARGVGRETGRDGWALLRHSVLVALIAGVLFVPWAVSGLAEQISGGGETRIVAHYAYTSPIRLPAAIVQAFSASPGVQSSEMLPKGLFIAIAVNLAFIALVTLGAILVARKDRSDATLFICIGAVTVIPLVAYTQFIGPIANVRFVIFLAPVWYLLAAMGADFLCKRCAGGARPSITTGAALLLAALISFPGLFAYVLYKDTIV